MDVLWKQWLWPDYVVVVLSQLLFYKSLLYVYIAIKLFALDFIYFVIENGFTLSVCFSRCNGKNKKWTVINFLLKINMRYVESTDLLLSNIGCSCYDKTSLYNDMMFHIFLKYRKKRMSYIYSQYIIHALVSKLHIPFSQKYNVIQCHYSVLTYICINLLYTLDQLY